MIVSVDDVLVNERIRVEFNEEAITELAVSMKRLGQLQPVVLEEREGSYLLISGEMRLRACKLLRERGETIKGLESGMLEAKLSSEKLTERLKLFMEFDENVKRTDFTYVEKASFVRRFHETFQKEASEAGQKWRIEHTAAALSLSLGNVSQLLRVEEAIKTDAGVAKATTVKAAIKRMLVVEKLKARAVEVKDQAPTAVKKAEEILLHGNCIELIKDVPDETFDLVHFDPPWGDDVARKSQVAHEGFDDSIENADEIINAMLPELLRVLKPDRYMIFWYRQWAYQDMMDRLLKTGFDLRFSRTPCIWYKPDKVSDANRFPEKMFNNCYETFFLARKGDPVLQYQGEGNVFAFSRDTLGNLIHPTQKPVELCEKLISLCTTPGEKILDPTAGSSSFLLASLRKSRKPLGFELSDTYVERGHTRLAEYLKTITEA